MSDYLAQKYDTISDECLKMAMAWRSEIQSGIGDRDFKADQHKRCIHRAAAYARLADKVRITFERPASVSVVPKAAA